MPRSLSTKDGLYWTSEMHGANTGRLLSRKMNSFASTALPNTAGGIWESMTKNPSRPRDTTNFPMGIFSKVHRCGVLSAESRAGQYQHYHIENAVAQVACWTPGRVRRYRRVHTQPLPAKRRAAPDIRRDDTIAVSAVHDPKHQAEQHAQQNACHQRKIKRYIFALDHDVARQPAQPDLAQIGPKQTNH